MNGADYRHVLQGLAEKPKRDNKPLEQTPE